MAGSPQLGREAGPDDIVRGGHALDQLPRHIGVRYIGRQVDGLQVILALNVCSSTK